MTAKFFADSNVVLYSIGKDPRKAEIARSILARRPVVSTQVINESINVCLRKLSFTREQAYAFGRAVMDRTEVLAVDEPTLDKAAALAIQYRLSHWDAVIVAAALRADCTTLFSEDLQHEQVFDELRVLNPFRAEIDLS